MHHHDPLGALKELAVDGQRFRFYSLQALEEKGFGKVSALPSSIKILLESVLRHCGNGLVREEDVRAVAGWRADNPGSIEIPFNPSRVVLQDFTGVPSIVDLAALRDACIDLGADPSRINPLVPCDLVVDHSLQVDAFGTSDALQKNLEREFERNGERYGFLKWGQQAFSNFNVVPPGTGIVHQVNLEHFSPVVHEEGGVLWPDSLVGTDSHTPMINALGVLGWGVGGIEAEAVMLGQPVYMLLPEVVGVRFTGRLARHVTATDLVLTVTQVLRKEGVVGAFVEFFGPGLSSLTLPDRAAISNMSPEYGATVGYFPIDRISLDYLAMTDRGASNERIEQYAKAQGLWHEEGDEPICSRVIDLDLGSVEPSLAGPKRPQDRISLSCMAGQWRQDLAEVYKKPHTADHDLSDSPRNGDQGIGFIMDGRELTLDHGSVVIAAITSCTNTSNPFVLVAAALLARRAREKGLRVKPWVKTSFAPGSRVVIDYLEAAGLMEDLEALGFANVGFGCTTCIGNSGPLPEPVADAIRQGDLVVAGVLSGNRNFEGRINPLVKANYLASPLLVVAYAIAGTIERDLVGEPLGVDNEGKDIFLRDIWPADEDVRSIVRSEVKAGYFADRYAKVHDGTPEWRAINAGAGSIYTWDLSSTYIRRPPFFEGLKLEAEPPAAIRDARCLALFGDSVTTDHISPAGAILPTQPAGEYLLSRGVNVSDFNSFGSRRGNHEVMIRGTFDNIRIRNLLAPGTEGGWTRLFLRGAAADAPVVTIYDASKRYREEGVPLIVIAGSDYGMGSSRDWAAKGTSLLGVRAVIAESFERIHRSNLVGMGVLPLQFMEGESAASLGLCGEECYEIVSRKPPCPREEISVIARHPDTGNETVFSVICRIDSPVEVDYYRHGGILPMVVRSIALS